MIYAISFLLIRALSRYRELAADRGGALLTGQPSALASALTKVSGEIARIPTQDLRAAEPFNAFYFAPAMQLPRRPRWSAAPVGSFSTHPSLDKRLEQLSKISARARPGRPGPARPAVMGFLDTLLGRTKPVQPNLDQLFALPSAAVTARGADRVQAHRLGLGLLPRRRRASRSRTSRRRSRSCSTWTTASRRRPAGRGEQGRLRLHLAGQHAT